MSPKKMKGMLKNMGIDIEELENVLEVVIRMPDREIVIENASVAIMDAHGTRSFQISGDARERSISGNAPGPALETAQGEPELEILDSDVDLVVSQTGAKTEAAKAALIEAKGDLAAAIMSLAPK